MAIEINGNPASQAPRTGEGQTVQVARNEPSAAQQESGRPTSLDTVSLTDTAAMMQKLDAVMVSLPVVDAQRVDGIQKTIANGQFEVDPQRVADKLVNFENALHGTGTI